MCLLSSSHSYNTIGFPFDTSWKDPEGNRWSLNSARVGIDDRGFWPAFGASIEGQLWEKASRHELGAGLDGGAELTTLFKHDKFLEKKRNERCPRHALGCGNCVVLDAGATIPSRAGGVAAMPEVQ